MSLNNYQWLKCLFEDKIDPLLPISAIPPKPNATKWIPCIHQIKMILMFLTVPMSIKTEKLQVCLLTWSSDWSAVSWAEEPFYEDWLSFFLFLWNIFLRKTRQYYFPIKLHDGQALTERSSGDYWSFEQLNQVIEKTGIVCFLFLQNWALIVH